MKKVLKFYADWCQPCKRLSETLKTVNTDVTIQEVNIDVQSDLAKEFKVRSVPTMVMLINDVETKRVSDSRMSKVDLERWFAD